jgi:hypothetical protein
LVGSSGKHAVSSPRGQSAGASSIPTCATFPPFFSLRNVT